jgi:1,4-alpha-glucan branching enzyme
MEWLLEAAAETYLPLLRIMRSLERDGIALHCNLNLSPILLEQLAHPVFQEEFPRYLNRKITAAGEDEAFFAQLGEMHYAETARFWQGFFTQALDEFNELGQDIIRGFRYFNDRGMIEIITSGATHGYLPLLGTDESCRAQVRTAVVTHRRHIGKHPRGIWSPECGYRPAGLWEYPVNGSDGSTAPAFERAGIEEIFSESGLEYFFVDTHMIEHSKRIPSPYELLNGELSYNAEAHEMTHHPERNLYQAYYVDGPYDKRYATTVFARDPRTGVQVWSGDTGYPGDGNYLDFHKKRWPGGHRYWRVTDRGLDLSRKEPYLPREAAGRIQSHASHFVHLVYEALKSGFDDTVPPILSAPFDAELFGHWWFEGPMWLEAVARVLHDNPIGIDLISGSDYLAKYPRAGFVAMPEGSWGAGGGNQVWLNPETSWTYAELYPIERYVRDVATAARWRASAMGRRIVQQMCRELLLLESSDWQFLITTQAARDYAELRFNTHKDQFYALKAIWESFDASGSLDGEQERRLAEIEQRDNIFLDLDPGMWVAGARQVAAETAP